MKGDRGDKMDKSKRTRRSVAGIAGAVLMGSTLLVTAAAGAVPGARGQASTSKPVHGGTMTTVGDYFFSNEDPASRLVTTVAQQPILQAIYGSLFDAGPQGQPEPDLATGYAFSSKNRVLTLRLRKGVKFSDGTPFNAKAVAFNLTRDADPSNGCSCAVFLSGMKSIKTPNSHTIVLHFSTPFVPIVNVLEDSGPAYIVSPTALRKEGASGFAQRPVGAGPYVLTTDVPNVSLTLTKSKTYWDRKDVYLKTINVKAVDVPSSAYATVLSGAAQLEVGADAATLKQAKSQSKVTIDDLPATSFTYLQLQTEKPPFNNPLAREAVADAINMPSIAKAQFDKTITPGPTIFGNGMEDAPNPSAIKGYPFYDPSKAKALVKKLGGLSFDLGANSNAPATVAFLTAIQQQLAAVGIKAMLTPSASIPAFDQLIEAGNFQAMLDGYLSYTDPGMYATVFFKSGSEFNNGFKVPKVDQLLAEADSRSNAGLRTKYFTELSQHLDNNHLIVPLYTSSPDPIVAKSLNGVIDSPLLYFGKMWLR